MQSFGSVTGWGDRSWDPPENRPAVAVPGLELALDEGTESLLEQVPCLADPFVVGDGHRLTIQRE